MEILSAYPIRMIRKVVYFYSMLKHVLKEALIFVFLSKNIVWYLVVTTKKGDVESYTYKTYGQVESDAKKFAYFLEKEGLKPGEDVFGIFSANNYEYDVAIIGGYYRNLANSSLYDTLGPQEDFLKF